MSGRLTHAAMAFLTAASLIVSPVFLQAAQAQDAPAQTTPPPSTQATAPTASATPPPARKLDLFMGSDYSNGPRWFPNIIAPYEQMKTPQPILTNSPRIGQLVDNGKLVLSLDDAISLALENNLDIAVERYTPWLDQANLLLAKSGVNGRTTFDPTFTSSMYIEEQTFPINNPFIAGAGFTNAVAALVNHSAVWNYGYTQGFEPGTQLQVTFDNTRSSSTSAFNSFNPAVQSSIQVELTQPLLNGFGKTVNMRYILEAKNTVKVGESQFSQQVMTTIAAVANDYWELVYARENVKVQQAAVGVSQKLYEDNKKQLEIGTMAPLDVLTAESQLATDQQNLIVAQTTQLQDETVLLNAITKDPLAGPLAGAEIVPTTPILPPDVTENISIQDAVKEAWQKRPELLQADLNLKNAAIEVKATKNLLLPTVNLFGFYNSTGLDGVSTPLVPTGAFAVTGQVFDPGAANANGIIPAPAPPAIGVVGTPVTVPGTPIPAGLTESWDQMIHSKNPTFEGGVNITLPIRNRAAQSANATAQLNEREQDAAYRRLQNSIFLSVRNAQIALEQGRGQVAAAEKARSLAQQTLDDEEKKYQLGSSTSYNVVLRSRDLTTAQGTELRARINLIEAAVAFNQAVGRTLEVNNISVADALKGATSGVPNIPGTPDADGQAGHK
jgi:outer membrane protein